MTSLPDRFRLRAHMDAAVRALNARDAAQMLGGPDPFPGETDADCREISHHYFCTRNQGHPLPHVAMSDVVVAVWPPYRAQPPHA